MKPLMLTHTPIPGSVSKSSGVINTILLLMSREWRRVVMEPSRLVGVLAQPLLFLLVFGAGFHETFVWSSHKTSYIAFFFPGVLGLVVLFSSIYATLTLVDDKKCGFFRLVLAGPGGILGAILGKVLSTAALGFTQAILFLCLLIVLPLPITLSTFLLLVLVLLLAALLFAMIGVLFAWLSPSPSAFHALMSVVLIPMWLLSGAMFPLSGFLYGLNIINPMGSVVSALRSLLLGTGLPLADCCGIVTWLVLSGAALTLGVKHRVVD